MRTGDADAGGVRIRYYDHGGDGPDLLCVHATGFHGRLWDPWVEPLRERFRVVAFDQRGHGDSDQPSSGYAWEGFGADVLAVVDHLSLSRPAAFGHSAGGAALVIAETSRPGTFSRLVLMDPVLSPPEVRTLLRDVPNPMSAMTRRRRRVWDSTEQMMQRLRDGTPLRAWRDDFLRAYVEHGTRPAGDGTIELKCPPEIEAQVYEMSGRHEGWERLAELRCPTMLLVGERSELWSGAWPETAAGMLSDGRLEVVADAGHFFPMERPALALERVLDFLTAATPR